MTSIGEAFVTIRPDAKRFTSEAEREVGGGIKKLTSTVAKAVGPALVGIGGALTKLGQSQEKATINLRRAVENTGTSFKVFGKDLAAAEKQQAKYGNNTIDTSNALANLTFKLRDPKKALEALALASDVAAAKNISLEAATGLVTKAYSGNAKVLGTFGINIKDSKTAIADATKAQEAHKTAVEKLTDAQQALSDLEAIQASKKTHTIADEFRLRDAKQAVADAQANVAATADANLAAQARSKEAIQGTEGAVGKLRDQVKGLADEQAATLEGRLKTLRVQVQNVAIDMGERFGPAITAISTATTIAANLIALKLTPALLLTAGGWAVAIGGGTALGVVLHNLIEEHVPGVNRALEEVGGKLYDFGAAVVGANDKVGLLGDAERILGLTGEATTKKVDGQIRALAELASQAQGRTKTAIQAMIEKLEAIHPEYRTSIVVDTPGIGGVLNYLNQVAAVARTPMPSRKPVHHNAAGGPLGAHDVSWVGERGKELFVSSRGGRVLSHEDSMRAVAGGDGGRAYPAMAPIHLYVNLDGRQVAEVVYDPLRRMNAETR